MALTFGQPLVAPSGPYAPAATICRDMRSDRTLDELRTQWIRGCNLHLLRLGRDGAVSRAFDRADYSCLNCGHYSISSVMQKIIKNGHAEQRLANIVEKNGRRYLQPSSR